MNKLIIVAISFYQEFVSPYKGFCCASGVLHNEGTCSMVVKDIIGSQGMITGFPDIVAQFKRCRIAAQELSMHNSFFSSELDGGKKDNEKKKSSCWGLDDCVLLPAACVAPDPSDCAIGGVFEATGGACGSMGEGVAGVCSCL